MEFCSPTDVDLLKIEMSTSRSSSNISSTSNGNGSDLNAFQSLESLNRFTEEEDDDFDTIALDENPSRSPTLKRYLYPKKEFVEELRPEEIRWFHKQEDSKKWTPFIGYDSLRIECRYRALNLSNESGDIDENEKILVRGGLYEVDVKEKTCAPVYWSEESSVIMRGLWFEDGSWQPMDEAYTYQIETEHMTKFRDQPLLEAPELQKGPKPVIHHLKFKDFHIDWNATNEVYKFNESTSSKLIRNVKQSLGWQKSGTRLYRGYCVEAVMDDKPPDICHLVFVIHGIGHKMDTGSIVRCTKEVRDRVKYMRSKMFPDFDSTSQRAEFLPVQWRSSLKLDGGDTVESVTPHKMKGVRNVLNSSAMDVLYYTSPLYRSEITHSLKCELIRLYQMFCSRHPYFEPCNGKVSIVAHSLGAVISYDIITGWNPVNLYDQLMNSLLAEEEDNGKDNDDILKDVAVAKNKVKELEDLMRSIRAQQKKTIKTLPFQIENLFCIGSPLAVFLALRGIRPLGNGTTSHILPSILCKHIFNIFHPSDPVAYRIEPLILKHYTTIMPLAIHHFSEQKKLPYSRIPSRAYAAFTGAVEEITKDKAKKDDDSGEVSGKEDNTDSSGKKFSLSGWFNNRKKKEAADKLSAELQILNNVSRPPDLKKEMQYTDADHLDKTELEYRIDFQLKEQRMENSYLSVLTSHTSYWTNKDVAYFLLTHLHPELQEEENKAP